MLVSFSPRINIIATITGIKKYEEVIKLKTPSKNGFEISDIILNRDILFFIIFVYVLILYFVTKYLND